MAKSRIKPLCTVWLLAILASPGLPAGAQPDAETESPALQDNTIQDTRAMLDKWLELRQTIAKQQSDWALTKEMMHDRIELMKANIQDVRQEIAAQREKLSGFDDNIDKLEDQEAQLKQATEKLETLVASMEARTVKLVERAPAPLLEQAKPLAVQLPGYKRAGKEDEPAASPDAAADVSSASSGADAGADAPAQADATAQSEPLGEASEQTPADQGDQAQASQIPLSRRVENVVGVLYLINKYSGRIEQTRVSVQQPDVSSLSTDALFLGLSAGYYVNDEVTQGGFGWGAPQGWTWQDLDQPQAASRIKQAISVFNQDQPAAYIGLPAEVKE